MSDLSAILSLPYLQPSQAQKHVTHNEALRRLDVAVQLAVTDRDRTIAPGSPAPGDRHIVAPGGSGDWAGADGQVAVWEGTGWAFHLPQPGWRAHVLAEAATLVWSGSAWVADVPAMLDRLGINATPDATNRLAVAGDATLLSHDGAGHRLTLNKAEDSDTASLLFQTGWSGRAEIGTTGDDALSVKVSADGSTWTTALSIDGVTGRPEMPGGLVVQGTLGGSAVQTGAGDTTAGRLLKVGAFGLGAGMLPGVESFTGDGSKHCGEVDRTGFFLAATDALDTPLAGGVFHVMHLEGAGEGAAQVALGTFPASAVGAVFTRARAAGSWSAWTRGYGRANLLGPVSQTGGVPTGAVIERGGNAHGEYVRFADGTQICTRTLTLSTVAPSNLSAAWTYPAPFSALHVVTAAPDMNTVNSTAPGLTSVGQCAPSNETTTGATIALYRITSLTDFAGGDSAVVRCLAIGRWF